VIARWWALPRRTRVCLAAAVIAVVLAGAWARARGRGDGDWVEAKVGDVPLSVEVTGTLKAVESDLLGPPQVEGVWEFKIAFLAPDGGKVRKGQPVLGFDASTLQRDLESKVAERDTAAKEAEKKERELALAEHDDALALAEAEARLRRARMQVERPDELVASKELEKARLDLELAESEVAHVTASVAAKRRVAASELAALRSTRERAAARVAEITGAIERMTVKAGRDGTLVHIADWRGDKRKAGDTVWRADKVVEVPDLRAMAGKGEVDEADAGKLAAGQPIRLRLDAHPDIEYPGTVAAVARSAERRSWQNPLKIVRVDITLAATDEARMRPGMRFRGQVEYERRRGVVLVPVDAVFPTPAGPVVYRRTLAGTAATPVRTGARNDEAVEIVSGLAAGDLVSRRDLGAAAEGS
jgi:HlyD family secretion protein